MLNYLISFRCSAETHTQWGWGCYPLTTILLFLSFSISLCVIFVSLVDCFFHIFSFVPLLSLLVIRFLCSHSHAIHVTLFNWYVVYACISLLNCSDTQTKLAKSERKRDSFSPRLSRKQNQLCTDTHTLAYIYTIFIKCWIQIIL